VAQKGDQRRVLVNILTLGVPQEELGKLYSPALRLLVSQGLSSITLLNFHVFIHATVSFLHLLNGALFMLIFFRATKKR
jgi:hypothetical protein